MNDRFLEITRQYLNSILDEIMKQGTEYKELYDKQSDFAKLAFWGQLSGSKRDLENLFRAADEMEKQYLNMNVEVN